MRNTLLKSSLCIVTACLSGCFYEVRDASSGRLYYTDKWVAADGYQGPLTFEDYTGLSRRIEHAQVIRIPKQDYLEATAPAAAADSQTTTSPPQ